MERIHSCTHPAQKSVLAPTRLLLFCFISYNDVPPASQRNVSMTAERGVVRPSITQPNCCCVSILITTTHPRYLQNGSMTAVGPPCVFPCPNHRNAGMIVSIYIAPGRVAQSVGHLTRKSGVLGSIPGLATYFRFSFRFFKKGSCQLLAKVCARSTG